MSSPLLNNVIICGSILTYVEVLVSAIDYSKTLNDSDENAMCTVSYVPMTVHSIYSTEDHLLHFHLNNVRCLAFQFGSLRIGVRLTLNA